MVAATRVASIGKCSGLLDTPWPSSLQAWLSPLCFLRTLVCLETIRNALFPQVTSEQEQLLQPRPVAGKLPVVARLECRLAGLGRLLSDCSTRAEPRAGTDERVTTGVHRFLEQISDERVMTALHANAGSLTADGSRDPAPLPEHNSGCGFGGHGRRHLSTRTPRRCEAHFWHRGSRGRDELYECHTGRAWHGRSAGDAQKDGDDAGGLPHHGEVLPNDLRATRRSAAPLERALNTADYGRPSCRSRTTSRPTFNCSTAEHVCRVFNRRGFDC